MKKFHYKARAFKSGECYDIFIEAKEVNQTTFLKKCREKVPPQYQVEIIR